MSVPGPPEGTEQPALSGLRRAEAALADPLKAETRKARLYLLGVSMVGIAIVWTGLVPQEITTLGIKFGQTNRGALLILLSLVVIYFLCAFAIYGASDFIASRYAFLNALWSERIADERKYVERHRAKVAEAQTKLDSARGKAERLETAHGEAEVSLQRARERLEEWELTLGSMKEQPPPESIPIRKLERLQAEVDKAESALDDAEWSFSEARDGVLLEEEQVRRLQQSGPEHGLNLNMNASVEERLEVDTHQYVEVFTSLAPRVSLARLVFEFVLPLLVGGYAIYALLSNALWST